MTKKLGKYERVYGPIWNQYLFLTSVRERQEHRFEVLVLLASILIFIFFALGLHALSVYNYVALGSYILVFLIALYDIMPRGIMVPWVEKEDLDKKISDPNKIAQQLVEEVYEYIKEVRELVKYRDGHQKWIIILILFGSLVPFVTSALEYGILYALCIGLVGVAVILFFYQKFGSKLTDNKKHLMAKEKRLLKLVPTPSESIKKSIVDISKKPHFKRDLFLLVAVIPFILSLLFLLPTSTKDQLILHKDSPQIYTLFTNHFIHKEADHFFNNIASYTVLIMPIYLLNLQAGQRRKFYLMMLSSFTLLPFLLSFLDLLIPARESLGFSGIVAAFVGFLPYSLSSYLKKSYDWKVRISTVLTLVLLFSFGVIAVRLLYYGFTISKLMLLAVVWGLVFAKFIIALRGASLKVYLSPLKQMFKRYGLTAIILLVILITIYLERLLGLFPEEIVVGSSIIGIHTHYAGFVFGFLISYFFVKEEFRKKK